MPRFSLFFSVEEPPHNGISFHLESKKSSYSGFCVPIQSIPTAFHRILYKLDNIALVSITLTESNSLIVTFFNFPAKKAKQLCETAISMLPSSITFTIHENEFRFDQFMLKTAYEALITRCLEDLGWWLLNDSGSLKLFNQRGVEISDFKISSNPSLQHASQFFRKQNSPKEKITINMTGKTTYQRLPIFQIPNKTLKKVFKEKGFVDLDYIPCIVLPKFKRAFAVRIINVQNNDNDRPKKKQDSLNTSEDTIDPNAIKKSESISISSKEIQEIKDYWLYSHGILIEHVSAIIKISFTKGGDCLTYPIECVIDQDPILHLDLQLNKIDFEDKLENFISTAIKVVSLNQKSNS